MSALSPDPTSIPVLLLKTKSMPADSYEEYFSTAPFRPVFVPVLEHRPNAPNLEQIKTMLLDRKIGRCEGARYGGMIFTSQRAVEGFAKLVEEIEGDASRNDQANSSIYIHSTAAHVMQVLSSEGRLSALY